MFRILATAIVTTIAAVAVTGLSADAAAPNREQGGGSGAYQEQLDWEKLHYVATTENGSYVERCTDDIDEARGWAAVSNFGTQAGERENDKFFEFRYEDGSSWSYLVRAHKCSYVQPTADVRDPAVSEFAIYNGSTRGEATREFAEYMWFIHNYDYAGTTLDSVERAQVAGAIAWDLNYTTTVYGGGGTGCLEHFDHKQTISISRSTGVVTMSDVIEGTFQGECWPAF